METHLNQTHINFSGAPISNNVEAEIKNIHDKLLGLFVEPDIGNRVKLYSGEENSEKNTGEPGNLSTSEIQNNKEYLAEMSEIGKMKIELYEKLFSDLEESLEEESGILFFQVPLSHAMDFVAYLAEQKNNPSRKLSNFDIEYAVMDNESIVKMLDTRGAVEPLYNTYIEKAQSATKFIQMVDTPNKFETLVSSDDDKSFLRDVDSRATKGLLKENNKLRGYLPTQEMADNENMTLKEFYKMYLKATSLDWKRMKQANEELAELFRENDHVHITGDGTDIHFDIENMGAQNSVTETNWPGCEVYTAPVRESVNGKITYNNSVYVKMLGVTIDGIEMIFKEGRLEDFHILSNFGEDTSILEAELAKKLDDKEGNRYLGELAFGTNFFIPVGIKHPLIGEKAQGMHIALGRAFTKEGVDNGNNAEGGNDTSIHWDVIRSMEDAKVTFSKNGSSDKEITVMEEGNYSKENLPKLHKYQEELRETD